jgi:type II secretory pathway component PulC
VVKLLWLFNTLLAFLAFGLAAGLIGSLTWHASSEMDKQYGPVVRPPSSTAKPTTNTAFQLNPRRHLLSEFDSILHGNLFRNNDAEPQQKQQIRKPTPAVPLPILHGTMFVGGEAKAILKERDRQDIYGVGESVGGGTLTKIEEDRVVIDLGNRQAEVMLKSALNKIPPPSPPPLQKGRDDASKADSMSRGQNQKNRSREQVQDRGTRRLERQRRAQELFELQQQMQRGQR